MKKCEKEFGFYLMFNSLYTYHMSCLCHIQCHIQRTIRKVTSHKIDLEDFARRLLPWPKYSQWSYKNWSCPELTLTPWKHSYFHIFFFWLLENLYVLSFSLPSVDPTWRTISWWDGLKIIKDSTMMPTE